MASGEAVGISVEREVGENCGNLKFIAAANLNPSDHSFLSGVPITEQILNISSISELPGNSGRNVYSSAMMQPTLERNSITLNPVQYKVKRTLKPLHFVMVLHV